MPFLKLFAEMLAYVCLSVVAACLLGAFAAGVAQVADAAPEAANAFGWGVCLTTFAFLALTGRSMADYRGRKPKRAAGRSD